jgi:hypothetical protein
VDQILRTAKVIWEQSQQVPTRTRRGGHARGRPRRERQRPPTRIERLQENAQKREQETTDYQQHHQEQRERGGHGRRAGRDRNLHRRANERHPRRGATLIGAWATLEWRRRWTKEAQGKAATTWKTPWSEWPLWLYDGLPKHLATALFLMRTEVLGLNEWLASIRVPGAEPWCSCGRQLQTVRHVLLHCPAYDQDRADLIRETGTEDMQKMLSGPASKAAARWFVRVGALQQFKIAREIVNEDPDEYTPLPMLD